MSSGDPVVRTLYPSRAAARSVIAAASGSVTRRVQWGGLRTIRIATRSQERKNYQESFVRPGSRQKCQSRGQEQRLARPRSAPQATNRAEDEGAPQGRQRASPIALTPVTQDDEARRQPRRQERPSGPKPAVHHPGQARRGAGHGQPDPGDRPSEHHLSESQGRTLPGRVLGHVVGPMEDMMRLEVLPMRMRRVRQTAARKRVASEEIAELVVNPRLRKPREIGQDGARQSGRHAHDDDRRCRSPRHRVDPSEDRANRPEPAVQPQRDRHGSPDQEEQEQPRVRPHGAGSRDAMKWTRAGRNRPTSGMWS